MCSSTHPDCSHTREATLTLPQVHLHMLCSKHHKRRRTKPSRAAKTRLPSAAITPRHRTPPTPPHRLSPAEASLPLSTDERRLASWLAVRVACVTRRELFWLVRLHMQMQLSCIVRATSCCTTPATHPCYHGRQCKPHQSSLPRRAGQLIYKTGSKGENGTLICNAQRRGCLGYASLNYVLNSLHRGGCVSGIFSLLLSCRQLCKILQNFVPMAIGC